MNWLSREAGQQRRQNLNNALAGAVQYYLGPTGIPQRLNALGILNPVNDMEQASQNALAMVAPGATGRERFNAGVGMVTDIATAVAPAYAASRIGTDGAAALVDSLTGIGAMQRQGLDDAGQRFVADESGAIRAFHGSPHDFDRFSMDKIGTGEGAQAYGHGLYFADNEAVAREYRDALRFPRVDGVSSQSAPVARVTDDLNYQRGNVDALRKTYEGMLERGTPEAQKMARENLAVLDDVNARNPGKMYEVQINADPNDFLDWDKPLSEQPQIAQRLGVDPNANAKRAAEIRARVAEDMRLDGRTTPDEIDQRNLDLAAQIELQSATGDASSYAPRSMQMVDELKAKGIPGIRYLDAGSRGAGDGSRNYVVFDENLIEVVRKYGIAGAAAILGMSQAEVAQASGAAQ